MLENYNYNNIYTYPYLSYNSYVAIAKDNGTPLKVEDINFKEYLKYNEFCLKHGFMPYGHFSGQALEDIYKTLKQKLRE